MSNYLAFATVTASLRRYLQGAVGGDVTGATATALRPDDPALPAPGVNVYLYQVTPNTAWQNTDLPTRTRGGQPIRRSRAAFDLHYLLSFFGDEAQLEPQRVMGSVIRALHEQPVLPRSLIASTVEDPSFSYLAGSDLAEEVESVKYTPLPLSLEELSKLWSVFFQTPYALSLAYHASVVLVESERSPRQVLPVRERRIVAEPFQRAVIEKVVSELADEAPIQMNDTLVIRGSRLHGPVHHVRIGPASLQPVPGSVTVTELRVRLTHPTLRAGVWGVQVVYANGSESTTAPVLLRPRITVDAPNVTSGEVPIVFVPAVDRRQRVRLFLNERNAPPGRVPRSCIFDAPEANGVPADSDETTRIVFPISDVPPGDYLVRVQVNGAESVLLVGDDGRYDAPVVTIP